MRKFGKTLKTIGIIFIVLGFIMFAIGSFNFSPVAIIGFVMFAVGIFLTAIGKAFSRRIGEGLVNTVSGLWGNLKKAIDEKEAEDMIREAELKEEVETKVKAKQQKTCPYCGTVYNKNNSKCPGCGA